jgi:hypothetical protein
VGPECSVARARRPGIRQRSRPVDPETNAIVARIPVNGFHMAAGPDQMWVRFPDDGVVDSPQERWLWTRIDASTNEPSPPFEFPEVDPGFGLAWSPPRVCGPSVARANARSASRASTQPRSG